MIVARDYVAEIKVLHTFTDLSNGRLDKSRAYFKRHAWKTNGGGCGSTSYKQMDFEGYQFYTKAFSDLALMDSELKDIEAAFNDDYATIEGAYTIHHVGMASFDSGSFT